jgi:hypothetical protein
MLAGSIAAIVFATAAVVTVAALLLTNAVAEGAVAALVTAAVVLVAWAIRKSFSGVYIGDKGILIREAFNTEEFAWTGIAAVEARTSSHAKELGGPWSSLWIITDTGDALETHVIRGSYWMAPQPSLAQRMPPSGLYLVEYIFDAVLTTLKTELADRTDAPSRRTGRP